MVASRNEERLKQAAEEMKKNISSDSLAEIDHVQCNIRKEEQVQHLIATTLSRFGKLDFLINNGGGQFPGPAESFSLKGWNAVIETNLTGTFLCCREVYNQWMNENGGGIVNIIADMWKGFPMMSHTGAARAAVDNLTKSLALEWAASGVRVNSVAPGSSIYSDTAAANYGDARIFDSSIPKIPLKRLGTTEEISTTVCFLLSPASGYITGETIRVDGGSSIYSSMTFTVPDHNKSKAYTWKDDKDNKSML